MQRRTSILVVATAAAWAASAIVTSAIVTSAFAAPRDGTPRATRQQPPTPSATVPQTEPMDLDEGKNAQQMFSNTCSVCHQSPNGLAKGRGSGQLSSFLRQHYTTGAGQAGMLANYLASIGQERTPTRAAPADKPADPAAASRRPAKPEKPEKPVETRGRPEPSVASPHPSRRIRNEDGTTEPVEGLVVLPPGASDVPDDNAKPAESKPERRRDTRPEPAHRQRHPRPSETKPAETKPADTKPVETAKPAEPESVPATPAAQAEAPRPPRDPAAAHSPLTEDRPKVSPADVQEIPL